MYKEERGICVELAISEGSLQEVRLQLDLDNSQDLSDEEGRGGEREGNKGVQRKEQAG